MGEQEGVHGAEWWHCSCCQSAVPAMESRNGKATGSGALRAYSGRRGRRAEETDTPTGHPGVAATFGRIIEFGVASMGVPFTTRGTVLKGEECIRGCGVAPLAGAELPWATGELRQRW